MFKFTYTETTTDRARLGRLETPHGIVETPAFIFCATKAAIKSVTAEQMREAGTQIILSNTYHLMLQPGADVVAHHGGLQKFTGWRGPMLTDSGGFQIFSLGHGSIANEIKGRQNNQRPKTLLRITEEGARFKSYIDGRTWMLTPEESIRIQHKLGADMIVVLDECTPFHVEKSYTKDSMEMSHRWAKRCLTEFVKLNENGQQRLYGIIQGGVYEDLREQGCDFVNSHNFFGHAIGGSLGASKGQMYDVVNFTASKLDRARPIHLLGIGGIKDIFNGVRAGIDTFDCVHPTRLARHGGALVKPASIEDNTKEHINLGNQRFRMDNNPIEPDCTCSTCKNYSRGYIHHLLKANEMIASTLISIHNIHFMNQLLTEIREALIDGTLNVAERKWIS
ncbi:MAG: tRNA guanosine(34) transglycosylase Tgt [Alphaproteobacteria bacterium]|jgi:queuine tRNA-ribosyltransferase|nr:tRNA guanosine(34) transglycosylase Tgt [Alphaproteobacteria bacterium]MDP5012466.1 tRNA guanosine(34) transglycosylase Tgt [Alphaproteobacteria bacterium]